MTEGIFTALIGVVCIVIGISNRKGNISLLHSYHTKRVAEEDKLPMGKLVGLGMMIVGVALLLAGGLSIAQYFTQEALYAMLTTVVLAVGLPIGLGLNIYAIIKYNKGLF